MATPSFLEPFVLPTPPANRHREGNIDVYPPQDAAEKRPAVLFVHGGPLPAAVRPTPRDWPMYVGYASLAVHHGLVGITLDHRLHDPSSYADAQEDVAAALEQVRARPEVDPDRIALWFFSGAGPLSARWLAEPPGWLRCIALTYPLLATPPAWGLGPHLQPIDALPGVGDLPILLTRVGKEQPQIAAAVTAFLDAAAQHGVVIDVIDVPDGQHGFDILDHTEQSRAGVTEAMTWVANMVSR